MSRSDSVLPRVSSNTDVEQAILRVILVLVCAVFANSPGFHTEGLSEGALRGLLGASAAFTAYAVLWLIWVVSAPKSRHLKIRRYGSAVLDNVGVTAGLFFGGEAMFIAPAVYLWIQMGYALRMGRPFLFASAGSALASFAITVAVTPFVEFSREFVFTTVTLLVVPALYLAKFTTALNKAMTSAKAAARAKSDFLAQISHDFRTPLFSIMGLTEELKGEPFSRNDASAAEKLATVQTSAAIMLELVDDALDAAQVSEKAKEITLDPVDLHSLIRNTASVFRHKARSKALEFKCFVAPDVPRDVVTDAKRLRRVLTNLLDNSVKFTHQGHVLLLVHASEPARRENVSVSFSIVDSGRGIEPHHLETIFEAFEQGPDGTASRYGGFGLGTTIAREFVQQLGSRLDVESEQGSGSTFSFTLELEMAKGTPLEAVSQPPGPRPAAVCFWPPGQGRDTPQWGGVEVAATPEKFVQTLERVQADGEPVLALIHEDGTGKTADLLEALGARDSIYRVAVSHVLDPVRLALLGYDSAVAPARLGRLHESLAELAQGLAMSQAAHADATEGGPQAATSLAILVADDHDLNRGIIQRMLERAGHAVTVASDGSEVMQLIYEAGGRFDVLLLDQNMPGRSGVDCARLYREAYPQGSAGIIFLSADQQPADSGLDGRSDVLWLKKPISATALQEAVSRVAKVTAAGGEATPGAAPEQVDCDPLAAEFFRRLPDDLGAIEAALLSGDTGDARQQLHKLYGGAVFFAGEAFIGILEDVREATRDDDIDGALGKLATLRPASRLPEALSA